MHTFTDDLATLPPDQQRVRAKCYHPTGTFHPFPKEALEHSIPARFEEMVQLYPDRLAVKTRHNAITYMELNQQANRIAHAILTVYGQDEEPVALLLQEGIAVATALLGSLKAGKLFVALDPSFPATRLAVILHNARARLLVTDSIHLPLAHKLAHHGSTLLDIDALQYIYTTENPGLSLPPNRLAYIVYTSGSTGEPTGVLWTISGTKPPCLYRLYLRINRGTDRRAVQPSECAPSCQETDECVPHLCGRSTCAPAVVELRPGSTVCVLLAAQWGGCYSVRSKRGGSWQTRSLAVTGTDHHYESVCLGVSPVRKHAKRRGGVSPSAASDYGGGTAL
ncbi:MAG: AMP-binding protein [Deltaproteobacteria bacterium]|nr:AMP-binding protein [Deltaproteobacteria bacterium]